MRNHNICLTRDVIRHMKTQIFSESMNTFFIALWRAFSYTVTSLYRKLTLKMWRKQKGKCCITISVPANTKSMYLIIVSMVYYYMCGTINTGNPNGMSICSSCMGTHTDTLGSCPTQKPVAVVMDWTAEAVWIRIHFCCCTFVKSIQAVCCQPRCSCNYCAKLYFHMGVLTASWLWLLS